MPQNNEIRISRCGAWMCLILCSTPGGSPGDTEAGNHHGDWELFLLEVLQSFGAAEGVGGPVGQVT